MKENINEDETFRQNHELACDVAGTITNMLNHYMLNTMLVNFKNAGPIIEGINMASARMVATILSAQKNNSDDKVEEDADIAADSFKQKVIAYAKRLREEYEELEDHAKQEAH